MQYAASFLHQIAAPLQGDSGSVRDAMCVLYDCVRLFVMTTGLLAHFM